MKFKHKFLGFFSLVFTLVVGLFSTSCGKDEPKFIDYTQGDVVRLNRDYKTPDGHNRDFFQNGVSEVTLVNAIDGDTAHFKMKDSSNRATIKCRFYGIDTPESTQNFEDYGFAASRFTKQILNDAKTIVISATTTTDNVPPELDSGGGRYLTMIWFSNEANCPYTELRLLNLLLVQEGLSRLGKITNFPDFAPVFLKAEEQAKQFKLNLHSGKPDPEMAEGSYELTSIFDIKKAADEEILHGTANPYHLKNVKIIGTVVGYVNNNLYLQESRLVPVNPDEPDGEKVREYANINIFAGLSVLPAMYIEYGTRLQICGTCKSDEGFGFQIADVVDKFPQMPDDDPTHAKVLMPASEALLQPDFAPRKTSLDKVKSSVENRLDYVYEYVELPGTFKVTGGYDSDDNISKKVSLDIQDVNDSEFKMKVYIPFVYRPFEVHPDLFPGPGSGKYKRWQTWTDFKQGEFKVRGVFGVRKISTGKLKGTYEYQITPKDNLELELVKYTPAA